MVLVTGASGFTGRYMVDLLQTRGYGVPEFACDLTDPDAVRAAVLQAQPDYVVHLAALSFVGHGNAEAFYRVNVLGTLNLLEALAALPHPPQRVLVASSANVYGTPGVEVIDESICPAPVNHYACSKLAMEHMVRTWGERLPIVMTRPFNYTGVGQDEKFLIPKIVSHFRRRAPVVELGNLDVSRDFSDVRDVVAIYAHLLLEAGAEVCGQIFNVCSEQAYSLRELLAMVEQISGHNLEVRVNPAFIRANEVPRLSGSAARLQAHLGPLTHIPMEQTLGWMLADSLNP
ncbi:GDP-mannose 4,6-dehydratase [Acidithiobacillus sp. M4-SHS-6]|uniref:GDP-mannose 4,6-dehydratase n=1 Tax=Acidithiobacillus sp. M4-SHS-6 TaxID=3383024 RepID=UPI0039BEA4C3